jgi:hypothetical protein
MVAAGAPQRTFVGRQPQTALERQLAAAGQKRAEAPAQPIEVFWLDAVVSDAVRARQREVELGPRLGTFAADGRSDRPIAQRRFGIDSQHFNVSAIACSCSTWPPVLLNGQP